MKRLAISLSALLVYSLSYAQTTIPDGTEVSGNWTKTGSPYLVEGEAIIAQDDTLIVESGVEIKFSTGLEFNYDSVAFDAAFLNVKGKLFVDGTKQDSVRFTRDGDAGNWGTLFFNRSDSSYINYAIIEHAHQVINVKYSTYWKTNATGAISVRSSKLSVTNSKIFNNKSDGFYIYNEMDSELSNCSISNNKGNGINITGINQAIIKIQNSEVQNNQEIGIYIQTYSTDVKHFLLGNLVVSNDHGIYCNSSNYNVFIINNTIVRNHNNGIKTNQTWGAGPTIYNCIIFDNGFPLSDNENTKVGYSFIDTTRLPAKIINHGNNILGKIPGFLDSENLDFRLTSNSICIDRGNNTPNDTTYQLIDIAGNNRIFHSSMDIGAYEFIDDFLRIDYPTDSIFLKKQLDHIVVYSTNIQKIDAKLSMDNGTTWTKLLENEDNTGSFSAILPDVETNQAIVRILDATNSGLYDEKHFMISTESTIKDKQTVSGIWYKKYSPYIIEGEAIVLKGNILTIEPGVIVKFKIGTEFAYSNENFDAGLLRVFGTLKAEGTAQDSILFTRNGEDGNWACLTFERLNSEDESSLKFCSFEYGNKILGVFDDYYDDAYGVVTPFYAYDKLNIQNSRFSNNQEKGLNPVRENNFLVKQCDFRNNETGITIWGYSPKLMVISNNFSNNTYGIYDVSQSTYMDNTILNNNYSGISTKGSPIITNNEISGNGDGISCRENGSNTVVSNNYIHHNNTGISVSTSGRGKFFNNIIVNNEGGITLYRYARPEIINNNIINNSVSGISVYSGSYPTILNSIVIFNTEDLINEAKPKIGNCLFGQNTTINPTLDLGENLFGADPLFADTTNLDYSISTNSPCINAGIIDTAGYKIPALDYIDNPRIKAGRIDIGAYEYQEDGYYLRIFDPYNHKYLVSETDYNLQWNSNDPSKKVNISYSIDNGESWISIINDTENDGVYTWEVPELIAENSCKWAISDLINPLISDTSRHTFRITPNIIPDTAWVYGTWKKEYSPYKVLGKATIPKGKNLEIEPGVEVKLKSSSANYGWDFNGGWLYVLGNLNAEGKVDDRIIFTRDSTAGFWGGIFIDSSYVEYNKITHANIQFGGNSGGNYGAGIRINNSKVDVRHCIISNNKIHGINIDNSSDTTLLINNTIINNGERGVNNRSSNASISNTIFWGNKEPFYTFGAFDKNLQVKFSLIDYYENLDLYGLTTESLIVGEYPQFVDSTGFDYHLFTNSPAIDTGDPNDDFSLEPSPNGGRINMGAYGNTSEAATFSPLPRFDAVSPYECSIFGGDTLMVKGKYFNATQGEGFIGIGDSIIVNTLFWTDDSIQCIIPPYKEGYVDLFIENQDKLSSIKKDLFQYKSPILHEINPQVGKTSGNDTISIKGKYFKDSYVGMNLIIGDSLVEKILYWSDTLIQFINPHHPEGMVNIDVVLEGSISHSIKNSFLYTENDVEYICGEVSGRWTKSTIYVMDCSCNVPEGDTLIIEPGVRVYSKFNNEDKIDLGVHGVLLAQGSSLDNIFFSCIPEIPGSWQGIIVYNRANVKYLNVQNAINGLKITGGNANILYSTFENNLKNGVVFAGYDESVSGTISESTLRNNGGYGISCEAETWDNGVSVYPTVKYNQITGNSDGGIDVTAYGSVPYYGYVSKSCSSYPSIIGNFIKDNFGPGIHVYASGDEAQGNIFLMRRSAYARPEIVGNIISNNKIGIKTGEGPVRSYVEFNTSSNTIVNNGEVSLHIEDGEVLMENSIIWGDASEEVKILGGGKITATYCNSKDPIPGMQMISIDPLLDIEYKITCSSPCVNAGNPATDTTGLYYDYYGNPRIYGGIIDMGAVENQELPMINQQPTDLQVCERERVEFNATAEGEALIYQWFKVGSSSLVVENSTLLFDPVQLEHLGEYYCEVTNHCNVPVASDTVELIVNQMPTALVSGGGDLCDGMDTTITIALTGVPQWTFTVFDGQDSEEISTSESSFDYQVNKEGNYQVIALSDAICESDEFSGSAEIIVHELPTAIMTNDPDLCLTGEESIEIELTGESPWKIEALVEEEDTVFFSSNAQFTVLPDFPGNIQFHAVEDAWCKAEFPTNTTVDVWPLPTAVLTGGAELCEGESTDVKLALTGATPWNVEYSDGINTFNIEIDGAEYVLSTTESGVYEILSISDRYCNGIQYSGKASVLVHELPTASLSGDEVICDGKNGQLIVTLTGSGPWDFSLSDGITDNDINSSSNEFTVDIDPGNYNVISLKDQYCNGLELGEIFTSEELSIPVANFEFSTSVKTISFTNTSIDATDYSWDFGDGSTSTEESPEHSYSTDNEYTVELTASNACGEDRFSSLVNILTALINQDVIDGFTIYPNPTSDVIYLKFSDSKTKVVAIQILDLNGKFIRKFTPIIHDDLMEINLRGLSSGMYLIRIDKGDELLTGQIELN